MEFSIVRYCRVGFVDDGERTPTETERLFYFIIDPGLRGAIFVVFGAGKRTRSGDHCRSSAVSKHIAVSKVSKNRRYLARYRVSF